MTLYTRLPQFILLLHCQRGAWAPGYLFSHSEATPTSKLKPLSPATPLTTDYQFNPLYQSTIPLIICTQIFSHNNHVILEPYRLFPYTAGGGGGGTFSDEHVFKCVNPLASYQVPEHLHTPGRGHSRHYMQHQYKCLFFEDLLG